MEPDRTKCKASMCSILTVICKWFPVALSATLVGVSYYGYTVKLCFLTIANFIQMTSYLILYHITLAMLLWSWVKAVFTASGTVPAEFKLKSEDADALESSATNTRRRLLDDLLPDLPPVRCRDWNGSVRYCDNCRHVQPDRAHHCSVCRVCVLKMDHHCYWINNCVSFTNYKYYLLLLWYAFLHCLFVFVTSTEYLMQHRTGQIESSRHYILYLLLSSVILAVVSAILLTDHMHLVLANRSTIESVWPPIFAGGPDRDGFSLGRKANFKEVFGDDKSKWFLPVQSSLGDGVSFPDVVQSNTRSSIQSHTIQEDQSNPTSPIQSHTIQEVQYNPTSPIQSHAIQEVQYNPTSPIQSHAIQDVQSNPNSSLQSHAIQDVQSNPRSSI